MFFLWVNRPCLYAYRINSARYTKVWMKYPKYTIAWNERHDISTNMITVYCCDIAPWSSWTTHPLSDVLSHSTQIIMNYLGLYHTDSKHLTRVLFWNISWLDTSNRHETQMKINHSWHSYSFYSLKSKSNTFNNSNSINI